ncbi:MAG: UbiD family decarboxylase domain-containing protein [Phycisphaerales bacterium]
MYPTLRDFVHALDQAGELRRISTPTSPILDISRLADRESKSAAPRPASRPAQRNDPRFHHLGGHALLLDNVIGSDVPVLINAFGSYSRMELALGVDEASLRGQGRAPALAGFEHIAGRIAELVKPEPPRSLRDALAKARQFLPLLRIPPRRLRGMGLCQETVLTDDRIDLTRWPLIRCWPLDGNLAAVGYPGDINAGIPGLGSGPDWDRNFRGRYITLGGIHTIHADDRDNPRPASHNIGMYRVQLLGPRRMAMHWHLHHDGARHWRSWKALGRPMPVAIALGGEAILPYAATAPLPPGISELLMAGFLNGGGIPMCRARTVPLWVPANAEIVIEGWVSHESGGIGFDPRRADAGPLGPGAAFEGPFGDHTGFYSLPDRYPILDVTTITHRRDPIYPTTIVGLPPQEDYFLGKATERIFLPLLRTIVPDILDYDLPMFGAFHNAAFIRIRKEYPFHARRVMHAIWGAGQMSWTKCLFVVDDDVDVHDHAAVLAAASRHCTPGRDVELVNGPLDILDHAAPFLGAGTKIGYDCTRKLSDELSPPVSGWHRSLAQPASEPIARPIGTTPARAPEDLFHGEQSDAGARAPNHPAKTALSHVLESVAPPEFGGGWLLVRVASQGTTADDAAGLARAIAQDALRREVPPTRVLLVGEGVRLDPPDEALFHWVANMDAGRDAQLVEVGGVYIEVYDARPKKPGVGARGLPIRDWPPVLNLDV